jgi:hypothetical protein
MPIAPDIAAAAYVPTWRGQPLPDPGREIEMRAHFTEHGRTRYREYKITVASARLDQRFDGTRLVITVSGDATEYLLDEDGIATWWRYSAAEQARMKAETRISAESSDPNAEALTLTVTDPPMAPEDLQQVADTYREMPDPTDETITGRIRRFIAVKQRLEAIAAEEKRLKIEAEELSDAVVEMMIEQDMDSPPGVDGMTAYLNTVYYAEKQVDPNTSERYTTDAVLAALNEAKLGSMISQGYNGNQMRALLREYEETGQELPEALAKVFVLRKRRVLAVTPMAAKKRDAAPNRS